MNIQKTALGGGCHWCTEAVFASLKGIINVQQGWIASTSPNNIYSEAVLIMYDALCISLEELIAVHIATHAATSDHSMRYKYRSAVYYFHDADCEQSMKILQRLEQQLNEQIITQVLPFVSFKENDPIYQNYYYSAPEKPFCRLHIEPKINLLKEKFTALLKND